MSFSAPKRFIEENDTVIVYLTASNRHAIDVKREIKNKNGELIEYVFQTAFGAVKVASLIGIEYGSKITLTRGWAYVLQPTPELWTVTLPHRTQIIYTPDISMILLQLEVEPGKVVIESGTGSGSLSHAFIRAVKPHGHLHTFDFHELRVEQARQEFKDHGLENYVTAYHGDACASGFTEALNGKADAVFLDLPAPWLAVPNAVKALKSSGGRFCSFSPCIEQSQRCCEALRAHKFIEVQTMEVLQMEHVVKTKLMPVLDLDFVKQKKAAAVADVPATDAVAATEKVTTTTTPMMDEQLKQQQQHQRMAATKQERETKKVVTTFHPFTLPGHTGYLTFATFPPSFAR